MEEDKKKKSSKESKDRKDSEREKEHDDRKKRRRDDDDEEEDDRRKDKKRKSETEHEEFIARRARTRSMSDAEEHFKLLPAQNGDEFRAQHQITIVGKSPDEKGSFTIPNPMTSFADTPFSSMIRRALEAAGFEHPTPTQAQSWPIALQGRDIITVAKTGSGKTCGFLLPAFHRLMAQTNRRRGPPGILVLAPTRELACQIEEQALKFGRTSNIRSACAYGGSSKQ